ncbi:MAG: hypothetical protein M3154_10975 [Candidatus Eremiobacteraeota bacterium]|nr:hypothetical protein [Candidatus Eremiobacteraeota bacterium]
MRQARVISIAAALGALACRALGAQGTLSTQGFGYPAGGTSTRNAGAGGALGEFDPLSPLNPAALAAWGPTGLYFQLSPEYRTTGSAGGTDKTTTVRFPLLSAAIPLGDRWTFGASSTTFLDRTWRTEKRGVEQFADDSAPYSQTFGVSGSINETRIAAAYRFGSAIRFGVAGHVFTGSNRLKVVRLFDDTTGRFGSFNQASQISYAGGAFSAGVDVRPASVIALAFSARVGGTLRSYSGDTVLTSASTPKHYAGSLVFTGLAGTNVGVRAAWDGWSSLSTLGDTLVKGVDGWDVSVGGETRGVSFGGNTLPLRAGVRWRTLPFAIGLSKVKETAIGGGLGIPLAAGRANIDLSLQRANRTGVPGVTEHAWLLGLGFTVRP